MDVEGIPRTVLVEHSLPGGAVAELEREVRRICAAAESLTREGTPVRIVRSTIVPDDEAFLALVEAASEHLVRTAFERAGVPMERISRAIVGSYGPEQ